ncbi:MAG: metallophosphoesterase [Spirochaetia bacterium]|nr:metallophosphoesterase [Spirochaetia bacterium]
MIKIAAIGDIHGGFDETDISLFNKSDYDLVLVVGDLPGRTHVGTYEIARRIGQLTKPVYFIPGNHDGVTMIQLLAELKQSQSLIERAHKKQFRLCEQLKESLGPANYCGYSIHPISIGGINFTLLAARPHSMGGAPLAYKPFLEAKFGISTMDQSTQRLNELIDRAESPILVLAHNGPTGLGSSREDIFGCDFRPDQGDFGDHDLEEAIKHAKISGKRILGVVAGHMHHKIRGGGERVTQVERDNVLYVNTARVPRIFKDEGKIMRHHVRLHLSETELTAEAVYWT